MTLSHLYSITLTFFTLEFFSNLPQPICDTYISLVTPEAHCVVRTIEELRVVIPSHNVSIEFRIVNTHVTETSGILVFWIFKKKSESIF